MQIAINAADLDHPRIDGTRIYIQNLLKNFGPASGRDQFFIYHKSEFNPELKFPVFQNYEIIKKPFPFWWTQTRFSWEVFRKAPDVLFMPMHSLPLLRSKKTKTVVTIHDLAFKIFPQFFPKKDLRRLNFFTDYAAGRADKLIAVSNSTKNDLLRIYPGIDEQKIKVIYHGYDREIFNENVSDEQIKKVQAKYQIPTSSAGRPDTRYIIYVGALQPRKNISILLEAFRNLKNMSDFKDLALVIAGEKAWMYKEVMERIQDGQGIVFTGKFETKDLPALLRGAEVFVLPSLYEGFGLPAIEAMACGVPVIAAGNSSLSEIVSDKGMLFETNDINSLREALVKVLTDENLRKELQKKGLERAKYFSWEKCARETLSWMKS